MHTEYAVEYVSPHVVAPLDVGCVWLCSIVCVCDHVEEQEVKEAGQAGRAPARLTTHSTSSSVEHHPQRAAVPVGQGILRASSRLGNPSEFPMFPPGRPPDQELPPVTESVLEEGTPARVVQPSNQII